MSRGAQLTIQPDVTWAFLFALVAQAAGVIWWTSSRNSNLKELAERVTKLTDRQDSHERLTADFMQAQGQLLARLDERSQGVVETVKRIETRAAGSRGTQ